MMARRLIAGLTTAVLLAFATPALGQPASLTTNPRSAAGALARGTALVEAFPLPTGVVWTTKATKRPDLVEASQTVVVSRRARGSHAVSGLLQFARTHPVAGMVVSGAGPIAPTEVVLAYDTKAPTYTSAEADYTLHGAEVQLELEVTVGWAPARPADTLLPTSLQAVTVEVWPAQQFTAAPVPTFAHQVIHATGPAVTSLIHYLDGLPVRGPFGYGEGACTVPQFYGSTPRITFRTPQHVVVFQYVSNCQSFNVSVDGKHRPALTLTVAPVDPTKLVMTRLLGLVP